MAKTFIIAEKPSVHHDFARALGLKYGKEFSESDRYVISSAIGHLLEMVPPEGAEVKRGKWKLENLPVLPDHFDLVPKEKTKERLFLLKKLAERPDVTEIINACDAGREGELIFRNIMRWIGGKKPTRRLWLQSMTADSIRASFEHLRSEQQMRPLADAARSRAESDWLVGINATRALTSFNSRSGGFQMTAAGRVQTPTLALYEKHMVLTYQRTDSRYLPEDNLGQVRKVMSSFDDPTLARHAQKALNNDWVKPTKRVFNNARVSDHHAIVPTGASSAHLDEFERKIFDMVARRTIAVFYPAAQFEVTTRITRIEGEPFKTDGKIIVDPGWLAVYGKEAGGEDDQAIVPVTPNESAKLLAVEIKENETKPPARFTEATLLSAMEGAGKLVEDEELREAMRERGLGTPATRSQIIEGLIHDGYIERKGKELIVSAKGLSLITLLRSLHTDVLCTPEMTGEWESRLKQMAHGKLDRRHFMEDIRGLTRDIVERVRNFRGETIEGEYATIDAKCPNCGGGPIKEDYKTFRCQNCDWLMWKTMASRQFEPEEVHELLAKGRVGPLQGFRSKMGRPFEALVKLGAEKKPLFDFGENGLDAEQKIDTEKHEALGLCPVCHKGRVYVLDRSCACENAIATPKTCNFRISKNILHLEIPKEQVQKLITTGKTDLLHKFISKKGRAFSAYLKLEDGKVGFEFEEKKTKPKKKVAAPKAAAA